MPKPAKGPRLGGGPAHERLMLRNLATALFTHGSITTTETKAKRLQPFAERLVTFAKRGDLHARRRVLTQVTDKTAVHILFTEIAPQVAEREGGYTRITKLGYRKGDNAPLAVIELVLEPVSPKAKPAKAKAEKPAAKAVAEEVVEDVVESAEETAEVAAEVADATEDAVSEVAEVADEAVADAAEEAEEVVDEAVEAGDKE